MKKYITIILMSILWINMNSSFNQLRKIPTLIEHFFEHHALDASLTIFDYLYNHYVDDDVHGDFQRDNQLPFKEVTHATLFFTLGIVDNKYTNITDIIINAIPSLIFKEYLYEIKMGSIMSYHGKIFQPPRQL